LRLLEERYTVFVISPGTPRLDPSTIQVKARLPAMTGAWRSGYRPHVSLGTGLPSAVPEKEDIMQIGTFNVRRSVITVIVLVVAGLTATAALANSPHFKKGREPNCLMAGSAISKSVTCGVGLAVPVSVPDNNNTLPYDEFGLGANQPNQPQVGNAGPQTGQE
jgi:hypothetical protein